MLFSLKTITLISTKHSQSRLICSQNKSGQQRCCCSVTEPCPTLYDPMGSSAPGASVHGILQARTLEWACHFLLQGIFLTQGSNPLSHLGSPNWPHRFLHTGWGRTPQESQTECPKGLSRSAEPCQALPSGTALVNFSLLEVPRVLRSWTCQEAVFPIHLIRLLRT